MTPSVMHPIDETRAEYLRDESRRSGRADAVAFPRTEEDVREVLRYACGKRYPITIQGARTGITAGAVPSGGIILNMSRMRSVTGLGRDAQSGSFSVWVQPGVLLSELRERVASLDFRTEEWSEESLAWLEQLKASPGWFFPPDPTETGASLGGMVACNASGARSLRFGAVGRHVRSLRVMLADGDALVLTRGSVIARGRRFALTTVGGRVLEGELPDVTVPRVKSSAGYYVADSMDMLDLFFGMEGTLGVVTEIECVLSPLPLIMWGLLFFLPSRAAAVSFVRAVRGEGAPVRRSLPPVAIEYFDCRALELVRKQKKDNPAFSSLAVPDSSRHSAVYVEFHGDDEDEVMEAAQEASQMLVVAGGDDAATWLADTEREMEKLKQFRHAVPESVNLLIDERRKEEPGLTKLGTDMAVPDERLEEILELYEQGVAKEELESVVFGHIGNNHLHVNILPRNRGEYERGARLYQSWARAVVAMGGTVSAEHGIGKLKTGLLELMYTTKGIEQMRALKRVFDPGLVLNPGTMFEIV